MKFIVERDAIETALSVVVGRTRNNSIPILSHLLVEGKGQSITLTGHDLDSCSQATVSAEITEAGSIVIPADRFSRLVSGLPAGAQVSVAAIDGAATVRAGRSSYRLLLLNPTDFPPPLSPRDPVKISLTAKQVVRLFKVPAPCICDEKSRVYLAGIYLHLVGERLAACATNGHILVRAFVDATTPPFEGVIIPAKSCEEIVRLAGKSDCALEIAQNLVAIEAGTRRFVSKVIDGTFPDYGRVIPAATAPAITVHSADIDSSLQRIVAACDPERSPVALLSWEDGVPNLKVSLRTTFGEGDELIDCDAVDRRAGEVGAQVSYLRDTIGALGGSRTRFFINGTGDPIRMENPDDDGLVAVCMPCRV